MICDVCVLLGNQIIVESSLGERVPFDGEMLTAQQIKNKFGEKKFTPEGFKIANDVDRAGMASSLIANKKQFLEKSVDQIRRMLGENTGYFWNDFVPAYLIGEGWKSKGDTWQIVFLPDKNKKVRDVIVNKNCCH